MPQNLSRRPKGIRVASVGTTGTYVRTCMHIFFRKHLLMCTHPNIQIYVYIFVCISCMLSHTEYFTHIKPHHYISYHIIFYHIIFYHIIFYHIKPHQTISDHITSHHITSHHTPSHHTISHHIKSHHIISHHITSHHITSHHITSDRKSVV